MTPVEIGLKSSWYFSKMCSINPPIWYNSIIMKWLYKNSYISFTYIFYASVFKLHHRSSYTLSNCYSSYKLRTELNFSLKLHRNLFRLNIFRVIALSTGYILGFKTFSRLPISPNPHKTQICRQRIAFSFSSSKQLCIKYLISYAVEILI